MKLKKDAGNQLIKGQGLEKGDRVKYIGNYKERINKIYTINSIGKYGLVYFFIKDKSGNKKSSHAYAFYLEKIKCLTDQQKN